RPDGVCTEDGRAQNTAERATDSAKIYTEVTQDGEQTGQRSQTKIDTLVVNGLSADVIVRKAAGEKIGLDFRNSGSRKQQLAYELEHHVEGNALIVEVVRKEARSWFFQMVNNVGLELRVDVPDNMKRVEIRSASGDVDCAGIRGDELAISSMSGDLDGRDLDARKLEMKTASGDIKCVSAHAEEAHFSSKSGDVELEAVNVRNIVTDSISGDVAFRSGAASLAQMSTVSGDAIYVGPAEDMSIRSTSGDVAARVSSPVRAKLKSISGDVALTLENSRGYRGRISTISGDASASFGNDSRLGSRGLTVNFGTPESEIEADSKSGDVTIKA
ncbi:MAG: DUF4097 family beta strand repeat protein, partial [Lachnospiraceae bacterium]|nr:DUF4097 family beta strand repeat protein [Lachnospiraceae bacterium]